MAELLVRKAHNESFNSLSATKSPQPASWYLIMTRKCAIILIAVKAHKVIVNFYTFAVYVMTSPMEKAASLRNELC